MLADKGAYMYSLGQVSNRYQYKSFMDVHPLSC